MTTVTLYFKHEAVVKFATDHTRYGVLVPQLVVTAILFPRDNMVAWETRVVLDIENEAIQLAPDEKELSLAHGLLLTESKKGSV